jgi:putative two-component system response regulator
MPLRLASLSGPPATVLIVDDEPVLRDMISRWLTARGYRCLQASCANSAWECLQSHEVQLITMDITMPGESGLVLLAKVKAAFPEMPVLMLTASGHTKTAIEAMTAGASGYLVKPIQQDELLLQVLRGLQWRALVLERTTYLHSLEEKVRQQTGTIRQAHEETIHRLVSATMCRDEETGAHIIRTGLLSESLARAAGWSQVEAEQIRFAAPMHDIGKIGIPDAILQKPGKLTPEEYEVMKQHTVIGANILAGSASPILRLAQQIAHSHHERWDGEGYPQRLAGEAIPLAARIISIVDVYDALTHDRVYRPAFSHERALVMMQAEQGRQFDSALLTTFLTIAEEFHEISRLNPDNGNSPLPALGVASILTAPPLAAAVNA